MYLGPTTPFCTVLLLPSWLWKWKEGGSFHQVSVVRKRKKAKKICCFCYWFIHEGTFFVRAFFPYGLLILNASLIAKIGLVGLPFSIVTLCLLLSYYTFTSSLFLTLLKVFGKETKKAHLKSNAGKSILFLFAEITFFCRNLTKTNDSHLLTAARLFSGR